MDKPRVCRRLVEYKHAADIALYALVELVKYCLPILKRDKLADERIYIYTPRRHQFHAVFVLAIGGA